MIRLSEHASGIYRFHQGDYVQVQLENAAARIRKPHLRTPGYIFGLVGIVERECVGMADNPEALAFRQVHTVCNLNTWLAESCELARTVYTQ